MQNLIIAAMLEAERSAGVVTPRLKALSEKLVRGRLDRLDLARRTRFKYLTFRPSFIDAGAGTTVPNDVSTKEVTAQVSRRTYALGAVTDLPTARVKLYDASGNQYFSAAPVRTNTLAGLQSGLAGGTLLHPFDVPFRLEPGAQLLADFINQSSATLPAPIAYTFAMHGIYLDNPRDKSAGDQLAEKLVSMPGSFPQAYALTLDRDIILAGTLGEAVTLKTRKHSKPLLIHGAVTNAKNCRVRITDLNTDYAWSADHLPVWAFAGDLTSEYSRVDYPMPHYLAPDQQLQLEFINGQDSGAANATPNVAGAFEFTFIASTP